MDIPALIILIVTLAAFVAIAIFALTYGRKLRFPDGYRINHPKTILIVQLEPGEDGEAYLHNYVHPACNLARQAVKTAWPDKSEIHVLDRIVVYFPNDETFDTMLREERAPLPKAYASYATSVRRAIGTGIPMVVARQIYMEKTIQTGEPVIHELLHVIGGERTHSDRSVWTVAGGADSIQARAGRVFARSALPQPGD